MPFVLEDPASVYLIFVQAWRRYVLSSASRRSGRDIIAPQGLTDEVTPLNLFPITTVILG